MKSECGLAPLITILCEKCTELISFKNLKKIGLTKKINEKNYIFLGIKSLFIKFKRNQQDIKYKTDSWAKKFTYVGKLNIKFCVWVHFKCMLETFECC